MFRFCTFSPQQSLVRSEKFCQEKLPSLMSESDYIWKESTFIEPRLRIPLWRLSRNKIYCARKSQLYFSYKINLINMICFLPGGRWCGRRAAWSLVDGRLCQVLHLDLDDHLFPTPMNHTSCFRELTLRRYRHKQ